jgi:hypothetical protein
MWLVTVSVDLPYPRKYEYRIKATGFATAVHRALMTLRKQIPRKVIRKVAVIAVRVA